MQKSTDVVDLSDVARVVCDLFAYFHMSINGSFLGDPSVMADEKSCRRCQGASPDSNINSPDSLAPEDSGPDSVIGRTREVKIFLPLEIVLSPDNSIRDDQGPPVLATQ